MTTGADGTPCHCDRGWISHTVPGPLVDGVRTVQLAYSRCPACHPDTAARIAHGLPRDDDAMERHRRRQNRRTGRTTD